MQSILTIDAHAAGEPCRVVYAGLPALHGSTMSARRVAFRRELDWVRTALTHEPRGHTGMFGAVLTPPVRRNSAFGLIFFDPVGYMNGCGHGSLCSVAVWWRLRGELAPPFDIDNPDDSVTRVLAAEGDRDHCAVELSMPPVTVLSERLAVSSLRGCAAALVHCGNTFLIVDANANGLPDLRQTGTAALQAVALRLRHDVRASLGSRTGNGVEVLLYQELGGSQRTYSTFVLFNGSQVDRSPCGTGSAALCALLIARRHLGAGEPVRTIGPAGAHFEVRAHPRSGPLPGLDVRLRGTAHITGVHEWVFSPEDDFAKGYVLA